MNWLRVPRAFLARDWESARSYRLAFVTQFVGIFTELILYYFLGNVVDRGTGTEDLVGEQGFFAFVLVGQVLITLISNNVLTFAQSVNQEQSTGSLEALMMTPQHPALLIASSSTYSSLNTLVTELLTVFIAVGLFGVRFQISAALLFGVVIATILTLVIFAGVGLAVAGATLVVKQGVTRIAAIGVTGLTLLGGVYYPTEVLPQPLRFVSSLLPITWALDFLRAALFTDRFLLEQFLLLLAGAVVALPLGLLLFRLGLDRARREGSLGQY